LNSRQTARIRVLLLAVLVSLAIPAVAQFETRASALLSTEPFAVAVGDFNRDAKLDLAVSRFVPHNGVTILLGNGDGTFRAGSTYSVGSHLSHVVAVDFRHNGILDLVLADTLTDDVYVMLGDGDGTFQSPIAYQAAGRTYDLATGDFTGD
jgi:hypothetical protein